MPYHLPLLNKSSKLSSIIPESVVEVSFKNSSALLKLTSLLSDSCCVIKPKFTAKTEKYIKKIKIENP